MKQKVNWLIKQYGSQLCSIAMLAATIMTAYCKFLFYQPKEPEGPTEFSGKRIREKEER